MIAIRDVVEYLEEKIGKGTYSDLEYELYSSYKWDGKIVFKNGKYIGLIEKIIREIKWMDKEGWVE